MDEDDMFCLNLLPQGIKEKRTHHSLIGLHSKSEDLVPAMWPPTCDASIHGPPISLGAYTVVLCSDCVNLLLQFTLQIIRKAWHYDSFCPLKNGENFGGMPMPMLFIPRTKPLYLSHQ